MQIQKSSFGALAAVVVSFTLGACIGGNSKLESIRLAPESMVLKVGDSRTFSATAQFRGGKSEDYTDQVEWTSGDDSIASFDAAAGVIVGVSVGTVEIQAYEPASGVSATATVTVTEASLEQVEMETEPSTTVAAGMLLNSRLYAVYSDGTRSDVTLDAEWSSSAEATARVSNVSVSKGTVTALAAGQAVITAAFGGMSATVEITVTNAVLQSVELEASAASVPVGLSVEARLFAVYSDGSRQDVTLSADWSTSDEDTASVSNDTVIKGKVTGHSLGAVVVTAEFQGMSATVTVTVTAPVIVEVHTSGPGTVLIVGQTMTLTATATYSDGTVADVTHLLTWYTSNYQVATVTGGTVNGASEGFVSIEGLDPITGRNCTYQLTVTAGTL